MGTSVILSTLDRIFKSIEDIEEFESTLDTLIENVLEDDGRDGAFWGGVATGMSCISFKDFLTYILTPHVAELLISQDLKITEDAAAKTRISSEEYGYVFFSETDDGRIDDITNKNIHAGMKENTNTVRNSSNISLYATKSLVS